VARASRLPPRLASYASVARRRLQNRVQPHDNLLLRARAYHGSAIMRLGTEVMQLHVLGVRYRCPLNCVPTSYMHNRNEDIIRLSYSATEELSIDESTPNSREQPEGTKKTALRR
jgi:hypothetical protein